MNRGDIEGFFKTLLLGDFEEHQNAAAQVVGGLISLIPILGQVMAARDITGSLYAIGARGGFKSATTGQIVNLGFAAFGAIPEVGSVFKTVFKPLYKERQLAKGAVNGGLQAIESMLGMAKGGAIGWIRRELLGKWASWVTQAINAVNNGLQLCIDLLQFLSTAGGWKSWLIPSSIQAMARELLPQVQALQGTLNEPLQRAGNEIQQFLTDLLGEQVATVVMAVGQNAVAASAVPGTRTKAGHNAADAHPKGSAPATQPQRKVSDKDVADARKGGGPVHHGMQLTRKALENMAAREKGLVGEHVVDYLELKRLGGNWSHDQASGQWSPANIAKLNDQRRKNGADKGPIHIKLSDLGEITRPGIDAVWQHGNQYTVTEAKASMSIGTVYAMGKYKEKQGAIPVVAGLSVLNQELHYLLTDSSDKGGVESPLMQMSEDWVKDRAVREGLPSAAKVALTANLGIRRVVLVTLESQGALEHVQALIDATEGKGPAEMQAHTDHEKMKEWDAAAIDSVAEARSAAHKAKQTASPQPSVPTETKKKKKT